MTTRAARSRRLLANGPRLCLAVATLVAAEQACAQPNAAARQSEMPSVTVVPPQCTPASLPQAAFLDSLRVELAGQGLRCCTLADRGDPTPTHVTLQLTLEGVPCVDDADRIQIMALSPDGQRSVRREVALSDVPPSTRPRALALAAAELIRLLVQAPREAAPEVAAPIVKSPRGSVQPQSPSPTPATNRTTGFAVHLEAESRSFPTRDTMFWGVRARISAARHALYTALDWGANFCNVPVELGELHLRSASIGLGFGPRFTPHMAIVDLGIRAELGLAWISGTTKASDVRTESGSISFGNLGLRAALEMPVAWRFRPGIAIEAGGVVRSALAEVNGQAVSGMTGYYLAAALGFAVPL